ncbi:MAG: phage tail tape measure protein, partial [Spirochaetia bacterium]|nr:phage tail tape measure protein [Spirochaetia bacterium]
MAGSIGATIRFMFTSDVTGFDLSKVDRTVSATRIKTEALNAAFRTLQLTMAATVASTLAIVTPFMIAVKSVGELDRTLRLAASAAEDQRVYTDMMGVISDLATTYGVAKDEISGAVFEMAKAGIAFEDMAELLEPTVQMATGNMMDLQDAMSVGIVMFNLFSDSGHSAAKMLSMIDKAATISILDVQDLSQIVEQTGSAFAMSQVPMEQYLALMASLSQEGITMGARHGSIISQMLGREGEIEAIVGDTALIEKGVLNMNLLMEYLRDVEEGSSEYQDILQVFGAGKGGKTFLDMMRAASGTYFDFTQEILGASDEMENKAKNMAESLPALMTRIKEAMTAPFANPEMIERINIALNSLLDTIGSDDYNNALVALVENSASFLTTSGPQIINMFTRLLMLLQDSFPTFNTFLNIGVSIMTIMSHI